MRSLEFGSLTQRSDYLGVQLSVHSTRYRMHGSTNTAILPAAKFSTGVRRRRRNESSPPSRFYIHLAERHPLNADARFSSQKVFLTMPINYKDYHPNWKTISREVREAAGQKCELCGIENYSLRPGTGSLVVLTVAHMDHNHNNNERSNLKALCQKCHLHHDRHQHADNRRYGRNWKKNQGRLDFE